MLRSLMAFVMLWMLAGPAAAHPLPPMRIILVGDSTMTDKSGYGLGFCARFRPEVTCINASRGGRSSKSYRVEGLWDAVMAQLADRSVYAKTYVWIGFGHNDGSWRPERRTHLESEFPVNMRQYARDIRAAGAVPVMVTPLTQRWFRDGVLKDDLRPWAAAIKVVAKDGGYALVDVYGATRDATETMGLVTANQLAGQPIPQNVLDTQGSGTSVAAIFSDASQGSSAVQQAFDYTHLGPYGSEVMGRLIVDAWAAQDAQIKAYVKD